MTSVAAIREGLRANLASLDGVQVSAYALSNPTPPVVQIHGPSVLYDMAFHRGADEWTFTVEVLVPFVDATGSQKVLDEFLAPAGPRSVKAALEVDKTLGGEAQDSHVTACADYAIFVPDGGPPALGARWTVRVIARGD